nr:TIGR03862 family flavoprotein [Panacagrimonas sp.]
MSPCLAIVGGGPAGLMAAEVALAAGVEVDLYERMGSVGRKFLLAGKGGLNLTHAEPPTDFVPRYRERADDVGRWLRDFDADALRAWAHGLGVETFVGTSGRVFPSDLKAAPLLRGWVRRLRAQGLRIHVHCRLTRIDPRAGRYALEFEDGTTGHADAVVLALGGGSWPELGSDGAWFDMLRALEVDMRALRPSNGGFECAWTAHFSTRFAGQPVKPVTLHWLDGRGRAQQRQGEFVVTGHGIEGGLVYAASADLRETIHRQGHADLLLDLAPGRDLEGLTRALASARGKRSIGEHLRRAIQLDGVRAGLLFEFAHPSQRNDPAALAALIKRLPLRVLRPRPLAEAISSAGGVRFEALDDALMLRAHPGLFCTGEMLDWEAPTGGYLLTACLAGGRVAGRAAARWAIDRKNLAP